MHPCHICSVLSSAAKYKSAQDMYVHPIQDTVTAIFKYKGSQNKQLYGEYKKNSTAVWVKKKGKVIPLQARCGPEGG